MLKELFYTLGELLRPGWGNNDDPRQQAIMFDVDGDSPLITLEEGIVSVESLRECAFREIPEPLRAGELKSLDSFALELTGLEQVAFPQSGRHESEHGFYGRKPHDLSVIFFVSQHAWNKKCRHSFGLVR